MGSSCFVHGPELTPDVSQSFGKFSCCVRGVHESIKVGFLFVQSMQLWNSLITTYLSDCAIFSSLVGLACLGSLPNGHEP